MRCGLYGNGSCLRGSWKRWPSLNCRSNRRLRHDRTRRRFSGNCGSLLRRRHYYRGRRPRLRNNLARSRPGCLHGSRWRSLRNRLSGRNRRGYRSRCSWRRNWWLDRCWPARGERFFFLALLNGFQHVARLGDARPVNLRLCLGFRTGGCRRAAGPGAAVEVCAYTLGFIRLQRTGVRFLFRHADIG